MNNLMKSALFTIVSSLALFAVILASKSHNGSDRTFVILSTNDMHAQIDKFPLLASAVEQCRDTVDVILVDAGDRWTGNAFVDLVDYYTPMYELLNELEYDITIYGNHEFDKGQDYLAVANRQAEFPIIGTNIKSDRASFPQPTPHYIVERRGMKIAFVGVVGNYDANDHPAGKDESYEGLTFINPHDAAAQYSYLAEECDMLVLVSHSGLDRDVEFAQSELSQGYDYIISAHSHDTANQVTNGKLISQTGSRLKNIGATTVTINRKGEITLSHNNIPLSNYQPHQKVEQMVQGYYDNPELKVSIGQAAAPFTEEALGNLFTEAIRSEIGANIGVYHYGGIRIEKIEQGDIDVATILNAEPFSSYIAELSMSVDNLKELVMAKFNDTVNIGESHRVDIVMTTPYTIITDEAGDATDVIFHELDPKKLYKIAMADYIFKTYRGLKYTSGRVTDKLVTTTLTNYIQSRAKIDPSNESLQKIEPAKK